jgi:hypothetical protein
MVCLVLRYLAEGRIAWGFWPPGSTDPNAKGKGIWIEDRQTAYDDDEEEAKSVDGGDDEDSSNEDGDRDDGDSDEDGSSDEEASREEEGDEDEKAVDVNVKPKGKTTASRFAMLELDEGEELEDENDSEGEEED